MVEDYKRYRAVVVDRRSSQYEGWGGHRHWQYFESRSVECRLKTGEVFRHGIILEEGSKDSDRINELMRRMMNERVHERSCEEMSDNPYWDKTDSDLWVESHHTGRMGAGNYSYRATASSENTLLEWGENLMKNYHPMGYGTTVRTPKEVEDGLWQCHASRAGSCD